MPSAFLDIKMASHRFFKNTTAMAMVIWMPFRWPWQVCLKRQVLRWFRETNGQDQMYHFIISLPTLSFDRIRPKSTSSGCTRRPDQMDLNRSYLGQTWVLTISPSKQASFFRSFRSYPVFFSICLMVGDVPWSKDIVVVFSSAGSAGFKRFLQRYQGRRINNVDMAVPISPSSIQWALLLDFSKCTNKSIGALEFDIVGMYVFIDVLFKVDQEGFFQTWTL